jgi:HEAT repeat protein
LVLVALVLSVHAQDGPGTRVPPDATHAVIDPALIGTWRGFWHIGTAVRFEIGPFGQLKFWSADGPAAPPDAVFLCEANQGRWTMKLPGGASFAGTYRQSGTTLTWAGYLERLSVMERVGPPVPPPALTLAPGDLDSISKLIELLNAPDAGHREIAALRLALLETNARRKATPAVPSLTALLKDPSPDIRSNAALALRNIGEGPPEVVASVQELLRDHDPLPRRSAVEALPHVLADPTVVVGLLSAALGDSDRRVRLAAVDGLGELGKTNHAAAAALATALGNDAPGVRRRAEEALRKMGKDAASASVHVLADILRNHRDGTARFGAESILRWLGPAAANAVPTLVEHLKDRTAPYGRNSAATILGLIGPAAISSVPLLNEVIDDTSEHERVRDAARASRNWILRQTTTRPETR